MGQACCIFHNLIHFMAEDTEANGVENIQAIHNRD